MGHGVYIDLQEAHDVAGAVVPEVVIRQRQLLNRHCTFNDAFCKSLDILCITTQHHYV